MSKRILSDKDRKTLLAKYKEDKLNDAPANISDKVLIENYGTDEQKALLPAPTTQAGAAKSNETATNGNGNPAPTPATTTNTNTQEGGVSDEGKVGADAEREHQVGQYKELYDVEPSEDLSTAEITALNVTRINENFRNAPADPTAQEYIDALNRYLELHDGVAPATQLNLYSLLEANEQKEGHLKTGGGVVAPAATPATPTQEQIADDLKTGNFHGVPLPNLQSTTVNKDVEKITLVNKEGKTKEFTKFTYEKYMLNDKNWKPLPQEPIEVQNIKK